MPTPRRAIAVLSAGVWIAVGAGAPGVAKAQSVPSEAAAGDGEIDSSQEVAVEGDAYADTDPSALSDFRDTLDPYGAWIDDPTYGTVWVPAAAEVGSEFAPYVSAGHWAYDGDYVWMSDYTWGWVAFHYGRWVRLVVGQWAWIPGRQYASAWVEWRVGDEEAPFVGWAAIPPRWVWRGGIPTWLGFRPLPPYSFCARADVFAPVVATRVLSGPTSALLATRTRPYVPARPSVVARPVVARPIPGPPPPLLGIAPDRVTTVAVSESGGLARARAFARPSTASPLGARPPIPHVARPIAFPAGGVRPRMSAPHESSARRR